MVMEKIIHRYKGKGFKLTPQRLAILKFLEGNNEHPTAEEIYTGLRNDYPTLSVATVYNTIETLRDRGEIAEVTIDPERKHFDPNTTPHHHLICLECKRIADIFEDYTSEIVLPAEVVEEFSVAGNHIDFYGVCKECRG